MPRMQTLSATLTAFALGTLLCLPGTAAAEDKLSAGGYFFAGTLKSIQGGNATFEIGTTKNTIDISLESLEGLETEGPRMILYGDSGVVEGRITGYADGAIEVEEADGRKLTLPVDEILTASAPPGDDFTRWTSDRLRYWTGNFDISASAAQATVNTTQILFGLGAKRVDKQSELNLAASYRYGTTQPSGEERQTNLDIATGSVNARYTVWADLFVFGDMVATYDAIQLLSIRTQPVVGVGYDLLKLDSGKLSAKIGYGWIYERYFGGDHDQFSTVAVGLTTNWALPLDSTLEASLDYLPNVADFGHDYLLQTKVTYALPIMSFLSFKLQVQDEYNDAPAPGATRNSFYVNVGLSLTI